MKIPSKFKIANTWIDVEIVDHNDSNNYGTWDDVRLKLTVCRKIRMEGEWVSLTEEQIMNSFYHELFHAFNWFYDNECPEAIAQVFANFMREYEDTAEFSD